MAKRPRQPAPPPSATTDLFETSQTGAAVPQPLAVRMRPRALEEFLGQEHLVGPGKLLRRAIEANRLTSLILYGPPGTGKTALAYLVASLSQAHFELLNATAAGVAELRDAIRRAKERARLDGRRTILFIDEIHRFNKAQQDVLMPDVEQGNPVLIGATTFNPFFAILPALVSRSLVCELKPLAQGALLAIMRRALADKERGLGAISTRVDAEALAHLAEVCDGDARRALNALEVAVLTTPKGPDGIVHVTRTVAEESIQKKAVVYDQQDDAHYDTISAFIKSMRGSDPDATLYWLAKMLYAGEDPRFIARRMVICAAEDVGNADPQALILATAAQQALEFVGLPEGRIPLAQAAVYIACAPKSNAAYMGIEKALKDVEAGRTLEVPAHLKDASYRSAKKLGRGVGYQYAHEAPEHFVAQEYLPTARGARRYYEPTSLGFEKKIKDWLAHLDDLAKASPSTPAPKA
ncbi:MAG: replication-associated recombination protein A [Candidatus Omnitrophica bacterium]|nr:replication-associated recombination protein A [Candidatus Omnitrophota bacterium]